MFLEHAVNEGDWQTDHIKITAFNAWNPSGSDALDGVGTRLVHRFTSRDIITDFLISECLKADPCNLGAYILKFAPASWTNEADAGNDAMDASGKLAQHTDRVGGVGWFLQDAVIDEHNGIGAENV